MSRQSTRTVALVVLLFALASTACTPPVSALHPVILEDGSNVKTHGEKKMSLVDQAMMAYFNEQHDAQAKAHREKQGITLAPTPNEHLDDPVFVRELHPTKRYRRGFLLGAHADDPADLNIIRSDPIVVQPPQQVLGWRLFVTDVQYQPAVSNVQIYLFQNRTFRPDTPGDFQMREHPKYAVPPYMHEQLISVLDMQFSIVAPCKANRTGQCLRKCTSTINELPMRAWYAIGRAGVVRCTLSRIDAEQLEIVNTDGEAMLPLILQVDGHGIQHGVGVETIKLQFNLPVSSRSAGHFQNVKRPIQERSETSNQGVAVCTTLTNINPFLQEMMAYYKMAGISHVYIGFNRRISMKRLLNAESDTKGPNFQPNQQDIKKAKADLKDLIDEGFVTILDMRLMSESRFKVSANIEKLFFWNSCFTHAVGSGDNWVIISDIDELMVFDPEKYADVDHFVADSLKMDALEAPRQTASKDICTIELKRRDIVHDSYNKTDHMSPWLGVRFPYRLSNTMQLFNRKVPIMPKVLVHRTAQSVSFHDVHCGSNNEHIVKVPEEKALFQHYTNMYLMRTRQSRARLYNRSSNIYTSKWLPKVRAEIIRKFPDRTSEKKSKLGWYGKEYLVPIDAPPN